MEENKKRAQRLKQGCAIQLSEQGLEEISGQFLDEGAGAGIPVPFLTGWYFDFIGRMCIFDLLLQ